MTPALLASSTDAIGTAGGLPLRDKAATECIARMQKARQRARIALANNQSKEMTQQEINEEIAAYRKSKRLAATS